MATQKSVLPAMWEYKPESEQSSKLPHPAPPQPKPRAPQPPTSIDNNNNSSNKKSPELITKEREAATNHHAKSANSSEYKDKDKEKNEAEEEEEEEPTSNLNAIIIPEMDPEFVKVTFKIPGLKTKRLYNCSPNALNRVPKNGRVIAAEYRQDNTVHFKFVVNEAKPSKKEFKYTSYTPFRAPIEESKSKFKFEDDTVRWFVHKVKGQWD